MIITVLGDALQVFVEGFRSLPGFWRGWIYLLMIVNGFAPLAYLPRFTAILVLVSAVLGFLTGLILVHVQGFTKLLGLMQFPWIPMVCFQIYYFKQQDFQVHSTHDTWLLLSLTLSCFSLVLDFRDVTRFLCGVAE